MIVYYCKSCWIYIKTEYQENDTGETILDKINIECEKCAKANEVHIHPNTLKTHCKKGHVLDAVHSIKGVKSRYCKICARMAEQRHRDRNPGYHGKYHKDKKDAT